MEPVEILYEDSQIFVVVKPPGMSSQPERSASMDMVSCLKNLLSSRDKVKNPYVSVVHRLDKPVGGVMVYARTREAAGKLSAQISRRLIDKTYMAVVHGTMPDREGMVEDILLRDPKTNTSRVISMEESQAFPDGKRAALSYQVQKTAEVSGQVYSLVKIKLETGRHHQIRVQMAHLGHPVAGDRRYGNKNDGFFQVGLFSCGLSFKHPVSGKTMTFTARPQSQPFLIFDKLPL
ncbi:MAG TPA: RluA family pseudouridine synthase [Candidatus Scybalocola faecigallinarum]|uniref:RNA pseudouridylate synthase n=1 Tax=Candidatus Scybalocola faecigallinarum TaxID=2840941 RepID=A0A9D1F351_9FIRM|nr:RluA family pseudouridine synthase [Candidatus Scybalocola faecigallinarum]